MNFIFFLSVFVSVFQAPPAGSALQLEKTISLPGVSGRIDHMAIDLERGRLFVAAVGNNTVEIVDLRRGEVIRKLRGIDEPQDVVYIAAGNLLAISSGGDGSVRVFDGASYRQIRRIDLGEDADNMRFDSTSGLLYVGYGKGGIAVLNPVHGNIVAKIGLPGHPESFQFDARHTKLFVNVPAKKLIAVVDLVAKTVSSTFPVRHDGSNFPMAIDNAHGRLFVGCRNPPGLLIYNTETTGLVTQLDINADCDDIFFNDVTDDIYVSCGEGFLDVIHEATQESYSITARIPSTSGSRTSLYVPRLHQIFLASSGWRGSDAKVRVYSVGP